MTRLAAFAASRRGAGALFAAGLAVYGLVSVGLPLVAGRDFPTYVATWVQLDQWDSVLPMTMLYRTPVAPVVAVGPLDLLGAWAAQAWFAALYAASIVAWSRVALRAGPRAALVTAVALLLYPGYVLLFHRLASDAVFAAALAGWALLVARAVERPTWWRFAAVGAGVAALGLTRPGNQVLLVVALAPLVLPLPWRRRAECAAAALGSAIVLLGAWAVNNGVRHDDYAVARGSAAYLPFFRVFTTDHLVDPANGAASRRLVQAIERDLLPLEPYRSRGVDVETFLARGSDRLFEDLLNLSDRTWGWDTDYATLRRVALESVRASPGDYLAGVASTLGELLWRPFYYELPASTETPTEAPAEAGGTAPGVEPPGTPSEDELVPAANQGFYYTTPDGRVREIWTSPDEHQPVFREPADAERFRAFVREVSSLTPLLPAYAGHAGLTRQVSRASRLWPRAAVWLVVGLAAVALRRPRGSLVALLVAGAGLLVLVVDAAAIYAIAEFAVPVVPAFVVLAAVGLAGDRPGRAATVPPR